MVHYAEAKMSKSIGNLVFVADLLRRCPADAIRLALVRQPYREDLTWTDDLAVSAQALVGRWTEAVRLRGTERTAEAALADLPDAVAWRREEVLAALANDLDTPGAIQKLDALAGVALGRHDERTRRAAGAHLHDLATRILGLRLVGG
jgi:cysteinyl-tRNA synthetase